MGERLKKAFNVSFTWEMRPAGRQQHGDSNGGVNGEKTARAGKIRQRRGKVGKKYVSKVSQAWGENL